MFSRTFILFEFSQFFREIAASHFILVTFTAAFFFGRFTVLEFANVFAAENQCSLLLKFEMMTMQNPDFSVRSEREISN